VGKLYGRASRVVIGELELTGLDIQFHVQRSLKPEPDTMQLSIWNLHEEHRAQLQRHANPTTAVGVQTKKKAKTVKPLSARAPAVQVRLEADYRPRREVNAVALSGDAAASLDDIGATEDAGAALKTGTPLPLIFGGDIREIWSVYEGTDWVTTLTSGDGDSANAARVNKSFGPGTPLRFAIEQVAAELGLGLGQLPKEIATAALWDGGKQFPAGIVLSGHGMTQLDRLLTSAGYKWTVQGGEIVVIRLGSSFGTAVLLTPETGLIGSPTPANDGRVAAVSLLQPDLVPGRQVEFNSRHVKGHYIVETAVYEGETAAQEWYVQLEAAPL
jgi:hypothetical protein